MQILKPFVIKGPVLLLFFQQSVDDNLTLLDIKMKGMDGIALLKHIRDIDKNIKVVMVTALNEQDKMDEAYRLGAVDYITKPLVLEHLEETVERHLKIALK